MSTTTAAATAPNPYYFRRRTIGRAASPPTWACYEEIPYDDDGYTSTSCSDNDDDAEEDSCSEDDETYNNSQQQQQQQKQDPPEHSSDSEVSEPEKLNCRANANGNDDDIDMDMGDDTSAQAKAAKEKTDIKGKQRAVDPPASEPEQTRGRRHTKKKEHRHNVTLRPILTIHRSQGFVWNQDLFIPPYAKDRYVASTSPPNARGFLSSNSSNTDYEVEVVEIRVKPGELFH